MYTIYYVCYGTYREWSYFTSMFICIPAVRLSAEVSVWLSFRFIGQEMDELQKLKVLSLLLFDSLCNTS